jgi:hypothetical protein
MPVANVLIDIRAYGVSLVGPDLVSGREHEKPSAPRGATQGCAPHAIGNALVFLSLIAAMLLGFGCMVYIDRPAERTISGEVVFEADGQAVPFAVLWFYSERRHLGMATNHGIDATAYADKDGKFTLRARLNEKVTALVYKEGQYQSYQLPPFPESNMIDGIIWSFKAADNGQP